MGQGAAPIIGKGLRDRTYKEALKELQSDGVQNRERRGYPQEGQICEDPPKDSFSVFLDPEEVVATWQLGPWRTGTDCCELSLKQNLDKHSESLYHRWSVQLSIHGYSALL